MKAAVEANEASYAGKVDKSMLALFVHAWVPRVIYLVQSPIKRLNDSGRVSHENYPVT